MSMIKAVVISLVLILSFEASSAQGDHDMELLPLIVKPGGKSYNGPAFAIISGDGGWKSFIESVCNRLSNTGMPIIALDSKKYFWQPKTPVETTAMMEQVIHFYTHKFNSSGFVLCGYSFGADIVPFMVTRFSPEVRKDLKKVILMSPDRYGDFEIHLSDMLELGIAKRKYNVIEEVKKINPEKVTCIFGKGEDPLNIQFFRELGCEIILVPGDHHYDNNYQLLMQSILKAISGY